MANDVTWFSLELVPSGWFDRLTQPDGWFDKDLLDQTATGDANFAGTFTLTFSQTGTLNAGSPIGAANFAGNTTLTFGQSGAFSAGAGFLGTASLTFSQSGSLGSSSAFIGSSALSFSQSGTLGVQENVPRAGRVLDAKDFELDVLRQAEPRPEF